MTNADYIRKGDSAIYKFNKNYFDKIDTTDKAYWIGFIWCDGYLNYRNRNGTESYDFKLSLIEKDINHLNIFKWYLDSNHIIRKYEIKSGFNANNAKEARLLICNKYFGKHYMNDMGLFQKEMM